MRRRSRKLTSGSIGDEEPMAHATTLIYQICCEAGDPSLIADIRSELRQHGIRRHVYRSDTGAIFNWLANVLSYQGISDAVAHRYMQKHGSATWTQIEQNFAGRPSCPKLTSYWHFAECGYEKTSQTCSDPEHIICCPLPTHRLRNGRLNQTAYSLFLFIRDIANNDLVGWVDARLGQAELGSEPDRITRLQAALIDPLRNIYGVSDKVLTMTLSSLLIGAGSGRPHWIEAGVNMIAIDTLVHNFLHRTGILRRFGADHIYGPACYRHHGCAAIIRRVATEIDARQFNPDFPSSFPRFVQHAIWRYCAQRGLDICNGNQIDDSGPCLNIHCRSYSICDRIPINRQALKPKTAKIRGLTA